MPGNKDVLPSCRPAQSIAEMGNRAPSPISGAVRVVAGAAGAPLAACWGRNARNAIEIQSFPGVWLPG